MYNPYDLLKVVINGKKIDARPIEFDSEVANNMTMLNAHGDIVKPTKVSTICPDCGGGMILDLPLEMLRLDDANPLNTLLESIDWPCKLCHPDAPPPVNPFMNPVEADRVGEHELDPLLHDSSQEIKQEATTVADRIQIDEVEDELEVSSAAHGTSAAIVAEESYSLDPGEYDAPEVDPPEATENVSETVEEEEAEEPQPDPEVEEKPKETPSVAEETVELELSDEMGEEEEIEDDLDDLVEE
jgi:hypothetical protein